jgi:hypothetical protein
MAMRKTRLPAILLLLVTHPGGHEAEGLTPDQKRLLWPFVAAFIRTERLAASPGQLTVAEALASFCFNEP